MDIDKVIKEALNEMDAEDQPQQYSQDWERFTDELSELIDSLREESRKPGFALSNVDIIVDHLQQALNLMVENY